VKFPYLSYRILPTPSLPGQTTIQRPVIPVRFTGPRRALNTYALLDTGADETYITVAMAKWLGVSPISSETARLESAVGEVSILYGVVLLEVENRSELFARQITVGIVDEPWSEAILGHVGFLEYFHALFSFADQYVELTPRYTQR